MRKIAKLILKVSEIIDKPTFLIGIPTFILLFFMGDFVLNLWLGNKYNPTIGMAFKIIVLGYLINLLSVPAYYYFMGIGKVKCCFLAHFIQSALNFIFILILIQIKVVDFKLIVISYSLSISISALLLLIIYYKNIGLNLGYLNDRIHKYLRYIKNG